MLIYNGCALYAMHVLVFCTTRQKGSTIPLGGINSLLTSDLMVTRWGGGKYHPFVTATSRAKSLLTVSCVFSLARFLRLCAIVLE